MTTRIAGLLLAAGAGSRMGRPKALLELDGELLVDRGIRLLREGGCAPVHVVLGAAFEEVVQAAVLAGATLVRNEDWHSGMGSSLRAGLASMPADVDAVVIALADQPLIGAEAVRRLREACAGGTDTRVDAGGARAGETDTRVDAGGAGAGGAGAGGGDAGAGGGDAGAGRAGASAGVAWAGGAVAAVATYAGRPRNPVLLTRATWPGVAALAVGDVGARAWLRRHAEDVRQVPCDDTGSPADLDTPADLAGLDPHG